MKRLLSLLFAGTFVGSLWANDATGRFGIGGAFGWDDLLAREDATDATDGDTFGSGWVRYGLSPRNELIIGYDSLQFEVNNNPSADRVRIRPLTLGIYHSLWANRKLTPVVTLGAGVADTKWLDPSGKKSQTTFAAQGGLGLEYFLGQHLSLGVLGRIHYVYNDSNEYKTEATAYTAGAMANLFWGGKKAEPAAAAPAPVPVVVAAPVDTDGDSVPDSSDACPGTPVGTPVDANGCPRDSDLDGVIDATDKCPGTPAGTLVDVDGCPVKTVSVTLDVKFDTGKAVVKPEFESQLSKVAGVMNKYPETSILIEGHSDNTGSAAGNKSLSQKRADAIRNELINKYGIVADRITAKGFGSEVPVADNATPEGRDANRRVVATLTTVEP
jgi:OOP family OmpA-OmpF porin